MKMIKIKQKPKKKSFLKSKEENTESRKNEWKTRNKPKKGFYVTDFSVRFPVSELWNAPLHVWLLWL